MRHKFYMSRTSMFTETFVVEADSEEEARQLGFDGEVDNGEPFMREWVSYVDDEWSIDDSECVDPLYVMIKEHKLVDHSA